MKKTNIIAPLAAAFILTAAPRVMAENADGLSTRLMNGSFEYPAVRAEDADGNNATGKPWYIGYYAGLDTLARERGGTGFYWNTTACDGKFEIVSENRASVKNEYTIDSFPDGSQCAELVAEEQASLYQNMRTYPGELVNWSLAHKARRAANNDSMAVFIGPRQAELSKKTAAGKDIFMWMGELLKSAGVITTADRSYCTERITVYSQSGIDLSDVTNDNYAEYFSLTKTDTINTEWSCWVITDTYTEWGTHSGVYEVPEGQTETVFAFTALDGIVNWPVIAGQYNEGNLIDNIVFETKYPLHVSTTAGGRGAVYVSLDAFTGAGELAEDGELSPSHAHFAKYRDGTEITVAAIPEDGYSFAGAYIDNVFREVGQGCFSEISGGESAGYYHTLTMDRARYVQLIFSRDHTVMFDPNTGTYGGESGITEITLGGADDALESYSSRDREILPPNDKTRFIGWYAGRVPGCIGGDYLGALLSDDISVVFSPGENGAAGTLNAEYTYAAGQSAGQRHSAQIDAESGITFVAQWEYDQRARAMTKGQTDAAYSQSGAGGTVRITNMRGSDAAERSCITTEGGDESGGWGQLADTVTMKAEVKDGYIFMGWFENGTLLSSGSVYTYEVGLPREIEARFCAVLAYPYLSFVAESGGAAAENDTFKSSHIKIGGTVVDGVGGTGETEYGNTISTGFSAVQSFNELVYNRCLWTIQLPADSPIYVKTADGTAPGGMTLSAAPVISDSDEVKKNKGSIYSVQSSVPKTIRLLDTLPTISGSGTVVFGVVLDNIYAPGATATLELWAADRTDSNVGADLTESDSDGQIHAVSAEEFVGSGHNWYR